MYSNFKETPDTLEIVKRIICTEGINKNARIKAIVGFLGDTGITVENIRDPSYGSLIKSIHTYLWSSDMKKYIQLIIDHPQYIQLDPRIVAIFNGSYLFPDSVSETKSSTISRTNSVYARTASFSVIARSEAIQVSEHLDPSYLTIMKNEIRNKII